jgi:hypothetical protein
VGIQGLQNEGGGVIQSLIVTAQIVTQQTPAVLIVVTIGTQIFPVGTVRWIISVVSISMMNGQEMPILIFKLSSAFSTDEPVYFKRLFSVIT